MHVLALEVRLRLPEARSLKDRRAVVRSILDGARRRFAVAAADLDGGASAQAATLGFAAVGGHPGHVEEVIAAVEGVVWSRPEVEVVSAQRHWLDPDAPG